MKKAICSVLAVLLLTNVCGIGVLGDAEGTVAEGNDTADVYSLDDGSFSSYYGQYKDSEFADETITVDCGVLGNTVYDNENGTVISENTGKAFDFSVNKSGIYPIAFRYYNTDESESDYIIGFKIDGEAPYTEAENFTLPRVWKDEAAGEYEKDDNGNDIRPTQLNVSVWEETYIEDSRGFYSLPYFVYLETGKHTVEIISQKNNIILGKIKFGSDSYLPEYKDYAENATLYSGENSKRECHIA